MSNVFVDESLKKYLEDKWIIPWGKDENYTSTPTIILGGWQERLGKQNVIRIRKNGAGEINKYVEIMEPRFEIYCRAPFKEDSILMAFAVRKILHRKNNFLMGDIYVYNSEILTEPEDMIDPDNKLPIQFSIYYIKIREDSILAG